MFILEELYLGNLDPANRFIQKGSEYDRVNQQLSKDMDALEPLLNEDEKSLLNKIEAGIYALGNIGEQESFIEGFQIGFRIAWEAIHYENKNFYH